MGSVLGSPYLGNLPNQCLLGTLGVRVDSFSIQGSLISVNTHTLTQNNQESGKGEFSQEVEGFGFGVSPQQQVI